MSARARHPNPVVNLDRTQHRWAWSREEQAQRLSSLSYDEILRTKVAFGTGPGLIGRLRQLKEELGLTGIAAELNPGGLLSFSQEMRSLEILTKQVMPAFK